VRLPRNPLQLRRPLHAHTGTADDQPERRRPVLPVAERHRFIWVWPGDPALADPATIPDIGRVTVTRWMLGIEPPPLWKYLLSVKFPDYHGPVDRWQIIQFTAPATICIDVGVAKAGTGGFEGDRSQGVNGYVLNTMCPTGPKTCRYLWAIARDFATGSQRITTELRDGVARVFAEDEAMLNAQQAAIDANPGYDFYNLNIDAGGMWARRLIAAMVERERS
jgi:vanillate O-demethylase monooxygenase subunit